METQFEKQNKNWSEEDLELLMELYGNVGMNILMKRLQRTESAIQFKALEVLGSADMCYIGGLMSGPQIADALSVGRSTVLLWVNKRGLPARYLTRVSGRSTENQHIFIEPTDFWNWLKNNKDRVNFARIKRGVILPEPDWLDEEIKKVPFLNKRKSWTKEEEEYAYFLYEGGMNYQDIADKLDRPPRSVVSKLGRIKEKKGVKQTRNPYKGPSKKALKDKLEKSGLSNRMINRYFTSIGSDFRDKYGVINWKELKKKANSMNIFYDEESKLWRKGENK